MKSRTRSRGRSALFHARNAMAARQIPCGKQGLRVGLRERVDGARRWRVAKPPQAKRAGARRNGTASLRFPSVRPARARGRRMSGQASRHVAVLLCEAVKMLQPREGGVYVDATFGAGGYS